MSKMDLYYMRGSPWSIKMLFGLHEIPDLEQIVTLHEFLPAAEAKKIRDKLGKPNMKVSAPILLSESNGTFSFLENGLEIIQAVAKESHADNDYLKSFKKNAEKIAMWDAVADKGMRVARRLFTESDINVITPVMPIELKWIPGLSWFINYKLGQYMREKYGELDKKVNLKDIEQKLDEAESILKTNNYLIKNKFSFADIAIAMMFEGLFPIYMEPYLTVGSVSPAAGEFMKSKVNWVTKYPNLAKFQKRILAEHLQQKTVAIGGAQKFYIDKRITVAVVAVLCSLCYFITKKYI